MTTRHVRLIAIAIAVCVGVSSPARAQAPTRAEIDAAVDARLKSAWTTALADAARELGLTVADGRLTGDRDTRVRAYTRAIDAVSADATLLELFTPVYIQQLIDERVESRVPTSVNATSTNPVTAGLPERSGLTSLMALATDLSGFAASDKSAVSFNLSGLAFISLTDTEVYSEIANYQRHGFARRVGGTVVLGAKIPEKELTGFSGVPEFGTLLDAFGWDVKLRVWGDKDPRSARWSDQTVRAGGLLTQRSAVLLSLIGTTPRAGESAQAALEDALIVQTILKERVGAGVADLKARLARAPQLSVKFAGTHLTKETGRNKYAVGAMFDVGAGPTDITANALYAVTGDIRFGPDQLFDTKIWTLAGEVTMHLAPDAIVRGRTIDWGVGTSVNLFQDKASLPTPAENTFKIFTRIEVPVKGGGKIPVSIIYSNDPNALTKEKFVTGQIGLSYDFGAVKQLFVD